MAKKKKDRVRATRTAEPAKVATPKIRIEEKKTARAAAPREMTFGPDTFKWMGIGFGLVLLGLILMSGSRGENYNEFDISDIYSPVKITLAPAVILAGLGVVVYAILKK